jgi:hypothetical protein
MTENRTVTCGTRDEQWCKQGIMLSGLHVLEGCRPIFLGFILATHPRVAVLFIKTGGFDG